MPVPVDSRYHRQSLLPGFGDDGQDRLARAHAVIVGCGALGCVSADILARAGIGTLSLIDRDVVEPTNLQRQPLYAEADVGRPKAIAAADRLAAVNSTITLHPLTHDFNPAAAQRLCALAPPSEGEPARPAPTVLIDGSDNFEARYLLNDVAVLHGLPFIYGGAVATRGMQAAFTPGAGCLRCVFPEPPAPGTALTCDTAGVLAPATAIVGAAQAADAIKIILSRDDLLSRSLLEFDLWTNLRRRIELHRDPRCPCCALRAFDFLHGGRAGATVALCGSAAVQVLPEPGARAPDLAALADRLARIGPVQRSDHLLRFDVPGREPPARITLFPDGRAIVHGVRVPAEARALCARYVGA